MELRGVKQSDWDALLSSGEKRHFPSGGIIFAQGDPVKELCVLRTGYVKCLKMYQNGSTEKVFSISNGYSFLGAANHICSTEFYQISAIAITDVEIVMVNWEGAYSCFLNHPSLMFCLLKCISGELIASYNQGADQQLTVTQRIARFLLLQDRYGMLCFHDYEKETQIDLSQEMIASILGVSRTAVCLSLRQLKELNIIQQGYKKIIILDEKKLADLCHTDD